MKEETINNITDPLEKSPDQPGQPNQSEQSDLSEPSMQSEPTTPSPKDQEAQEAREELRRIVQEQAREDELPLSTDFTLKKILGGEFLTAKLLRQQIWLGLLIAAFTIVYISNRYSCDQQRIEISKLTKELEEAKFKAMSSTSEFTEVSRESNVLEMLRKNKDSVLHIPTQPPYIINVPEQ